MDDDLRKLERAYLADPGDRTALSAYNRGRLRSGLEPIRDKTVHYVTSDVHHRLDANGEFDSRYGKESVRPVCNATEVWPRSYFPKGSKTIHYTGDKEQVTCKSCCKRVENPNFKEPEPRKHFPVHPPSAEPFVLCGARWGVPVITSRVYVTCRMCTAKLLKKPEGHQFGINARGRRRQRREAARMQHVAT